MALTYGFYNSVEGDRKYDAIQMGQIFDGIITDGVYATFLKAMVVKASDNPSEVIVQPGRCWFNHTWTYIDADYPVEAPVPEVILDRVDALVIDINSENAFRENSLVWVQGTPSSINPERPALIKSVTHNQYPLAYVYRKAGTTMIYAADITNAVGTSETPFVTGVLQGINIDDLLAQWDDEFHTWEASTKTSFEAWMVNQQSVYITWFNSIKDQMEGDLTDFEAWFETIRGIIDSEAATHLQAEIDDILDMLPAGSHIDISTNEQTLFNRNVTVSDGVHSKTVQFDSIGGATVESFPYIGIIDVSSTDGERIASESLNIPYFGRYSVALAFWSATVSLLGDETLAGLAVTVRDGNGDVVAIVTLNGSGQGVFTATKPDTYKFIYTYGGQTMEVSLAVTQETTYEVEIHGGFDWRSWLTAGRISESFSSLDDILEDEPTLRQLFLVHDSVDYICDTFTTGSLADITKIFNTDLAAKWINLSDYALDHFYAVPGIKSIMDTVDKYGYGEWTLMPQVPTMTSNTAPYGIVSASSATSSYEAYKAFDGDLSTSWVPTASAENNRLIYKFNAPTKVNAYAISLGLGGSQNISAPARTFKIQASNDGSDWIDLTTLEISAEVVQASAVIKEYNGKIENSNQYLYYCIFCAETLYQSGSNAWSRQTRALQFYAWAPKGNVPVMTSNTAPYGEASASSQYDTTNRAAFTAFNDNDNIASNSWTTAKDVQNPYIQYKFTNPVNAKKILVKAYQTNVGGDVTFTIKGSNDGTNFSDLGEVTISKSSGAHIDIITADVDTNDEYYLYYRISFSDVICTDNGNRFWSFKFQFYGRELKVSVPTMTSNTAPYGEVSASSYSSGYDPWRAFNGSTSNNGWASTSATNQFIQFRFTNKMVIKNLHIFYKSASTSPTNTPFTLYGSNDGNNFVELASSVIPTADKWYSFEITNDEPYLIYRLSTTYHFYSGNGVKLQFYGLDYSEKEFEAGATKKWLYDHGVELTDIEAISVDATKDESQLYWKNNTSQASNVLDGFFIGSVDFTPYSLLRFIIGNYLGTDSTRAGAVIITPTKSTTGSTDLGSVTVLNGNSNLPSNYSINASSINQSGYVLAGDGNSQSTVRGITIKELWLE